MSSPKSALIFAGGMMLPGSNAVVALSEKQSHVRPCNFVYLLFARQCPYAGVASHQISRYADMCRSTVDSTRQFIIAIQAETDPAHVVPPAIKPLTAFIIHGAKNVSKWVWLRDSVIKELTRKQTQPLLTKDRLDDPWPRALPADWCPSCGEGSYSAALDAYAVADTCSGFNLCIV